METLPKEIIIEIASNMELRDLKKFCSQNKAIQTMCEANAKHILTNMLKRKGYTMAIDLFLRDPKLLIAFYKIDPLFTLNDLNIVKAFSMRKTTRIGDLHYILTKFLLLNQNKGPKVFDNMIQNYSAIDSAEKLVIDRWNPIEEKTPEEISVLSELIRYSFVCENDTIPDDILERLKDTSGFVGNLRDDWKNCFRQYINEMKSNTFYLNTVDHLAFFISRKSHRYDYFIEHNEDLDLDDPNSNYTFQTLFFYCQKQE